MNVEGFSYVYLCAIIPSVLRIGLTITYPAAKHLYSEWFNSNLSVTMHVNDNEFFISPNEETLLSGIEPF